MSAHRRIYRRPGCSNAASIDGGKPTTDFISDPVVET
jgi:hypothetical protein